MWGINIFSSTCGAHLFIFLIEKFVDQRSHDEPAYKLSQLSVKRSACGTSNLDYFEHVEIPCIGNYYK